MHTLKDGPTEPQHGLETLRADLAHVREKVDWLADQFQGRDSVHVRIDRIEQAQARAGWWTKAAITAALVALAGVVKEFIARERPPEQPQARHVDSVSQVPR